MERAVANMGRSGAWLEDNNLTAIFETANEPEPTQLHFAADRNVGLTLGAAYKTSVIPHVSPLVRGFACLMRPLRRTRHRSEPSIAPSAFDSYDQKEPLCTS